MSTILLSVLLCVAAPSYQDLVGPVVKFEHEIGSGTAFAIDKDRLLTAGHLIPKAPDGSIWVHLPRGRVDATVLKVDRTVDLAVVSCPGHGLPPVRLAGQLPEDLSTVWAVGCPIGFGAVPLRGYLANRDPDFATWIRIVGRTFSGCSGGPVYDKDGALIGVLVMALQDRGTVITFLSYAVPLDAVKAFLTPEVKK